MFDTPLHAAPERRLRLAGVGGPPPRIDCRVLGRCDVLVDGRPLALRSRRQRTALFGLLCHAGYEVSTEALIDMLWPDEPPASATKQVRNVVAGVRRALVGAGAPPHVIETGPVGYRARVGDDELDLRRFERLAESGRAARAAGRIEDAVEAHRAALELWRGVPLGVGSCWPTTGSTRGPVEATVAGLAERRLALLEECVDDELRLGRHREVLGELHDAVAAHPFREGLRRQLMLALHRSGRRADALAVYQEGRTILVDQVGVEPGEALRRMERAILCGDPDLDLPAAMAVAPRPRPIGVRGADEVCAGCGRPLAGDAWSEGASSAG